MKKWSWKKQHKVGGLTLCAFMLVFAVSGLILNHRHTYSRMDLSRGSLPEAYQFKNWNNGLLRGTVSLNDSATLIFGTGGLWLRTGKAVSDFNQGLPQWADFRTIKNVVQLPDSNLVAAGQYGVYTRALHGNSWQELRSIRLQPHERISDLANLGDSLLVITRDRILLSLPPYTTATEMPLAPPEGYSGKVNLFRVVWLLHSGNLFGLPGRVLVDLVAIATIVLCLSGFLYWLLPKWVKRKARQRLKAIRTTKAIKWSFKSHRSIGVWGFVLFLIVVLSGWCLRPPLLIPLALNDVPGIKGTAATPDTPWADKLRTIRFDSAHSDWILSTSDGFYSLSQSLQGTPKQLKSAPRVSVMGVTVMEKNADGEWIIGSLSGLTRWNRQQNTIHDYFTGELIDNKPKAPFGSHPVAGFSTHFGSEPVIAEYYNGTPLIDQPDELRQLPMSVWQLALEFHTGRFYNLFGTAPLIWIFLAGCVVLWVLISGWKVSRRH